jgi:hypothetical protein
MKLDIKHLDRLIAEELQALFELQLQNIPHPGRGGADRSSKRPLRYGGKQTAIAKSSTKGGHKQTKGQREAAIAAKDAKTKEIQKWNPNYVADQSGFDPDNPLATDEYGERFDPNPNAGAGYSLDYSERAAPTYSGTGVRKKGGKAGMAVGDEVVTQAGKAGIQRAGLGGTKFAGRAGLIPMLAATGYEGYHAAKRGDIAGVGEAGAGMLGGFGGAALGTAITAPSGPGAVAGAIGGGLAGDLAAREVSRAGGEGLAATMFNIASSDKEKDALARLQYARKAQERGQSVGGKQTGIRSSGVEGGAKLVRRGQTGYRSGKMTYQHQVPGASAVAAAGPKAASTTGRMRPPGGWPGAPEKAPAATATAPKPDDAAKKAADAAAKTAAAAAKSKKSQEKHVAAGGALSRGGHRIAGPGQKAVSEGVKSTMLTENQIRRFQKLANCKSLRLDEGAKPAMLTEAIEIIPLIIAVAMGLFAAELQGARFDSEARRGVWPASKKGDPPEEYSHGFIKPLWNWLTGTAESKAEEGDSSLADLLSTIEFEAEKSIERLSPESIATIQEQFGDDEELGALLAQLAEVEEKDYRGVLSQVAQHIRSKLGT